MKKYIFVLAMLAGGAGSAVAACNPSLKDTDVINLLRGNTACSPANCIGTGTSATCQWQETHLGSGTLKEQHSGAPGDPSETVGTWSVANNGKITHAYTGGGGTYIYDVKDLGGGTYSFCGSNGEFTFSVKSGEARCP